MKNIIPLLALTSCANLGEPMHHETNQDWEPSSIPNYTTKESTYINEYTRPDFKFPDELPYTVDMNEVEFQAVTDIRGEIGTCVQNCHQ